jgi:hypothetical protein
MRLPDTISPDTWITHIFRSRAAAEGGVVRRKLSDIDRIVGREKFLSEVERRGYQAIENAGQVIILCNRDPVRRLR